VRITTEQLLSFRENVDAGKEYKEQTNGEEDTQGWRCLFKLMNCGEESVPTKTFRI